MAFIVNIAEHPHHEGAGRPNIPTEEIPKVGSIKVKEPGDVVSMTKPLTLNVHSEINKLTSVLLHRPGKELENLTPETMDRLLFDDIPYLDIAQREHDAFAEIFRQNGVRVYYIEDLAAEALVDHDLRDSFIESFIKEGGIHSPEKFRALKEFFESFKDPRAMVDKMIEGVRRDELGKLPVNSLPDYVDQDYPFLLDPIPNLYFTRDPFAVIGKGIALNHMRTVTRQRETLFASAVFRHHPFFKHHKVPHWYNRNEEFSMEGGDILVLNRKVLAIGISERTDSAAVEKVVKALFRSDESFEVVLAFDIPKSRAYMHLDTVFTMVDRSTFTIHPDIEGPLTVYSIQKADPSGRSLVIEKEVLSLEMILRKYLELDEISLIRCGGKAGIDAGREQWNDGSNTLAIAPGEVIVYERNTITNRLLEEHGIKLHVMSSSELSRGRGGPRCMSMPLERED